MRQYPTIVLPQAGAGTETINDAVVHYSITFPVWALQEKAVEAVAVLTLGAPGNLQVWIEVAPFDIAALYAQLGAITIIAATGSVVIPWTAHSEFARIATQALGAGATDYWDVAVYFLGDSK